MVRVVGMVMVSPMDSSCAHVRCVGAWVRGCARVCVVETHPRRSRLVAPRSNVARPRNRSGLQCPNRNGHARSAASVFTCTQTESTAPCEWAAQLMFMNVVSLSLCLPV